MEFQEYFKFLNFQVIKRKNAEGLPEDERSFLKLNLLDKLNNPCSFIVFDKDVMKKLLTGSIESLAEILVTFDLVYSNDKWNVRLVDYND